MFLFILESIGMQELFLVGVVALVVFGPRKLPEMARMIGKTMAEFRRVTGEFKETWEKEANFELDRRNNAGLETVEKTKNINGNAKVIENDESDKFLPKIREINAEDFDKVNLEKISVKQGKVESEKRNWL